MSILNNDLFVNLPFKNSIYIFLSKFSHVSASLLISVIIARKLGLEGFGVYTLVLSLYTMFELLVCFGFDNIIVREVAADHSKTGLLFSHGTMIGIISSAAGFLLFVILGNLMQYPREIMTAIYLVSGLLFPSFLFYLLEGILIGLEKSKYIFYSSLFRDIALVAAGAMTLSMGGGVNAVLGIMLTTRIFGFICLFLFSMQQKIGLFSSIELQTLINISRLTPTFLWIAISSCLFLEIDTVVLSKILPISELGLYNLAKRIFRVGNIFYYSFAMASYPRIVQAFLMPKVERISVYKRLMWIMFLLTVTLALLAHFLSGYFIHSLFGQQYMPAMKYLEVLLLAIIPLGLAFLLSRFLIAGHQQNKDLISSIGGVISLVLMGTAFSIKWGGMGMATAYSLTAFGIAGSFYYFTRRMLGS